MPMKMSSSARDPLWYKDAIIYETHVKAFFDRNDDGIGDFPGLLEKLDYIENLGVTCIWLLPFFPSPLRDDGYDISDYLSVHPQYGTTEDFQKFLDAAHERGLQVLIELVVNHTSDQHPWFQRARRMPAGSPERDFYVWSDTDKKYKDARIIFTDTEQSNWSWDSEAQAYYWHRFFSHQPDLNFENPAVIKEVMDAMRFWLDRGVDALRLDAIPYLVERDGTSCENLPETHRVIREFRAAMDERYLNRMILAEANQWPDDVRPYFGEGNECHMAFHFPLMPRLFMGLRLEDRHPITEIMSRTPEIPDSCQWGLFLRNHDELTLEMVTEDERDYMYLAYSADPRMRLNLGIRRRLAPLMDNNRPRIELLNSILFSFPGTPILYYGDEIGMGDNIYLGDRNGVRTPMQWSPDRNAGFSRANPARLFSPVIMDPVYGYEAVNVEAQQSDSSSLLHWMRNLISLRKLFRVFGRGSLEFLHPKNRKVLAYIRRFEDEAILCVANLSRFPQPVELDLSALTGMNPVEMLGYVEFPQIKKVPYRLTLGPYGFFWFELHEPTEQIELQEAGEFTRDAALSAPDESWVEFFTGPARDRLETEILVAHFANQRWFGGKAQKIDSVRISDWSTGSPLPQGSALAMAEVTYESGACESYLFPVATAYGERAKKLRDQFPAQVVCPLFRGGETGVLFDATLDDAFCQALLELIATGGELAADSGARIQGVAGQSLQELLNSGESAPAVKRGSAEQSNTSIIYSNKLILKLFRHVEPGPNPDFEIGHYLSKEAGFIRVPPFAGGIERHQDKHPTCSLALLQGLVANQGDGWKWTLEELDRYYEVSVTKGAPPTIDEFQKLSLIERASHLLPEAAREAVGIYVDAADRLGRRTAEMHLALAAATDDDAFTPEPFTQEHLSALSERLREFAAAAFKELKDNLSRLPDERVDEAAFVLSRRGSLIEHLQELVEMGVDGLRTRIHGDYHLGQVLRADGDFVILDFEGEPARSLAERRAKYSPLRDVAGMLRSFSYAAYSAMISRTTRRADDPDVVVPWTTLWEQTVSAVYLGSYRETLGASRICPTSDEPFGRLLEAFLLDKALYEMRYELNNRPDWLRIPLHGIAALTS